MIYANSTIETTVNYICDKLPAEDKLFIDPRPLARDNDQLRYVRIRRHSFIALHNYYGDKFLKDHPLGGLVVTIAAINGSRGNGDTDYLLKNAIADMRDMIDYESRCLVAEIHKNNEHAKDLFERNGFARTLEDDKKIYYLCYTRS